MDSMERVLEETTLAQMLAELATVDEKIKQLRAREHAAALDAIKALMADHQITLNDIAVACKPARGRRRLRAEEKQRQQRDPRQGELL
jgi:DNA-binding protein H-NS